MTSKIQIETDNDKIVNTQTIPALNINMDNIEVSMDEPSRKPRIEIPERQVSSSSTGKPRSPDRRHDSDSSSDGRGGENTDAFKFLINPKKFNPVIKEPLDDPVSESESSGDEVRKKNDTDSERSKRTRNSVVSDRHQNNRDDISDYKPRYSSVNSFKPFSNITSAVPDQHQSPPPLSNPNFPPVGGSFLGSNFPSRKSREFMSDEEIRQLKSHYLDQYEKKNKDYVFSQKRLTMKNDLEEIQSELAFITEKKRSENNMEMWKRGLVLFVDGVVVMNNYASDPFDLDLSDWSKEMHWDVFRAGKYDEIIEELMEKYHQKKVPIAPEWKLLFMMGSSMVYGVMQKKQEKARMKKRLEEERRMEEKVRNEVREQIAKMQFSEHQQQSRQQQQQHHQQPQRQRHQTPGTSSFPEPSTHAVKQVRQNSPMKAPKQFVQDIPLPDESRMTGPSMTEADIMRMMEANFIDSTIAGDDDSSHHSFHSSKRSSGSSENSQSTKASKTTVPDKNENKMNNEQVPKKRGRPRKEQRMSLVDGSYTPETQSQDKVISVQAPGRGGLVKRGRGRPPKNVNPDAVVTLERL